MNQREKRQERLGMSTAEAAERLKKLIYERYPNGPFPLPVKKWRALYDEVLTMAEKEAGLE